MNAHNAPTRIQKYHRIFVNRSLNFGNIKLIGFDMDHTLAPYDRKNFETLAFQETLKKFIEAGYPEELCKLEYKHDFVIRGLMVDRERGNILKVDGYKYVKDAYHGYRRLSKEERHTLYNNQSFKAQNFISVDTFFALSEVQLFVDIVDYLNKNPGIIKKSFSEIYADIRHFIDLSHSDGSIKNEVLKNPEKYIIRDKHLGRTLVRLLDAGKQLFLLTNSGFEYTRAIMSYVLDGAHPEFCHWKNYWDYLIVGSGKPGFFLGSQPFFAVTEEAGLLKIHNGPLEKGTIYYGGNAKLFEKLTKYRGDAILYVGDHIYGDIIQSKGAVNWRTMLVMHELEEEIRNQENAQPYIKKIENCLDQRELLDEELQKIRSLVGANNRQAFKAMEEGDEKKWLILQKENEKLFLKINQKKENLKLLEQQITDLIRSRTQQFHPQWGELMKVGLERSRFAHQVSHYACIYSSRVSNLRFYSPYKKFLSSKELLPHEDD